MRASEVDTAGARPASHFWRKLVAIVLVFGGITGGMIGLAAVSQGDWWGLGPIATAPLAIYGATKITPEGGTTGYFDENL